MHSVVDFTSSGEEGEVKDDGSEAAGEMVGKMRSHPLVSVSIINPDEIPDVPKNQFLYRAGPENNDEGRPDRNRERTRSTVRAYTKSGRKIKGRGSLVRLHPPSFPSSCHIVQNNRQQLCLKGLQAIICVIRLTASPILLLPQAQACSV